MQPRSCAAGAGWCGTGQTRITAMAEGCARTASRLAACRPTKVPFSAPMLARAQGFWAVSRWAEPRKSRLMLSPTGAERHLAFAAGSRCQLADSQRSHASHALLMRNLLRWLLDAHATVCQQISMRADATQHLHECRASPVNCFTSRYDGHPPMDDGSKVLLCRNDCNW